MKAEVITMDKGITVNHILLDRIKLYILFFFKVSHSELYLNDIAKEKMFKIDKITFVFLAKSKK